MKLYKHTERNGLQLPYGRACEAPDGMPEEEWRPLFDAGKLKDLGPFYVCHKCRAVVIEWETGATAASCTVKRPDGRQEQIYTCPKCAGGSIWRLSRDG